MAMKQKTSTYSSEYLDSLRKRFPEISLSSQEELVVELQKNQNRSDSSFYISQIENELNQIDQEILFDDAYDEFVNYFLEEAWREMHNLFRGAINYIIKEWKDWDFVMWYWPKEIPMGWTTTIWHPLPREIATGGKTNLVFHDKDRDGLEVLQGRAILVLVSIKNTGAQDSLWRKKYSLGHSLYDLSKSAFVPSDIAAIKKWETLEEFKQAMEKISK